MKLLRYGPNGHEMPGILDDSGHIRDLSGEVRDISEEVLLSLSLDRLKRLDVNSLPLVAGEPRIGACVGRVGKFICIGLNYSDHAAEAGVKVPAEAVIFMKATSAICGPNDNIVIPLGSTKTDWEVELGVVIGAPAKHVSEDNALSHVAGYCVINDVSKRAFQLEGTGQWTKGKSADTFGPIGPWLVTGDEITDPQNLDMWLEVDPSLPKRKYAHHGVRGRSPDFVFEPLHEPAARRHHLDRDTAWRRHGAASSNLSLCRKRCATWD